MKSNLSPKHKSPDCLYPRTQTSTSTTSTSLKSQKAIVAPQAGLSESNIGHLVCSRGFRLDSGGVGEKFLHAQV